MMRLALALFLAAFTAVALSACGERSASVATDIAADTDYTTDFAAHAFPPVMPDDAHHGNGSMQSWQQENCLTCHRTGVNEAPKVQHAGMSDLLLESKCRTCHTSTD